MNDLIGDLGGVFEVLVFIGSIILRNVGHHSFIIGVLQKNFSIKTQIVK